MSYTTQENYHTQYRKIADIGFTYNEVTLTSVALAACPTFTKKMRINSFRCLVFVTSSVLITEKETVCPVAATAEII